MAGKKGMKSSRCIEYWINKGYSTKESNKFAKSRMPGTFEYYTIFKKMDEDSAKKMVKEFQEKKCLTKENMITKYGKEEGIIRWNAYRQKQSISNTFEYKAKKYGWSYDDFIKYNKSRGLYGEKNPNYGTSYYKIWVVKYGKEKADEMNNALYNLKSLGGMRGGKMSKGRVDSIETKLKKRISAIKRVIRDGTSTGVNKKACNIIDEYGKQNEYNFQHAMNGGEYHVPNLPYMVDGYDFKKNVVVEYYEKYHYQNIMQMELDKVRQLEIMEQLKCKFIIISYNKKITEYNIHED